ncbi:MAG TPA: hypothetical protein VIV12_11810, partial [Streptosporangiaceae bacterium]
MAGTPLVTAFVRLRPVDTGFKSEASAQLKKSLLGVSGAVGLDLSDEEAKKKLDEFKARLLTLHGAAAGITVRDKDAQARLAALTVRLARLDEKVANPKVTLEGFARIEAELAAVDASMDRVDRKTASVGESARGSIGGFASLAAAGVALGPALLPVLGAATAGALGLGAAVAGAGSALGLFAAAATANLSELKKQMTKVQAANKSAALAEQTAAKDRTQAQKQAIVNARLLTRAFNKEFGQEAGAIDKLKSAWLSFVTQPTVTDTIAKGARLLAAALPHLVPLLKLGAYWAQALMGALGGFVTSGGLDRLVKGLKRLGTVGLTGLMQILHNLAVAFGALGPAAGHFAAAAVGGLVRLSKAFADWAQNRGAAALTGLFASVRKYAPQVGQLLLALVQVIPALTRGLLPLAPVSLAISTALAKLIAHANPKVITGLAVAFVAVTAAAKLYAVGAATAAVVTKAVAAAQKIATIATAAWGLAMDALPFVAIAAAVAALVFVIVKYHKQIWAFVVRIWHDVWNFIKQTWNSILSFAKQWWPLLLGVPGGLIVKYHNQIWGFIKTIWNRILGFFRAVWNQVWSSAKSIWGSIVSWFAGIPGRLIHALFGLGHSLAAFARAAFTQMLTAFKDVAVGIYDWFRGFVKKIVGFFSSLLHHSKTGAFYHMGRNMMEGLAMGLRDHAHLAGNAAKAAASAAGFLGGSGALGGDAAANKRLARRIFPFSPSQWAPFVSL